MSHVSSFSVELMKYNQMGSAASGKCWAQWKTAVTLNLKGNFCTLDEVIILLYLKERTKVLLNLKER